MYYYVYDTYIRESKYKSIVHACELRLNDFGIAGKIKRLTSLTTKVRFMTEKLKSGEDTLVAVGNDETVRKAINLAIEENVPLGIIPIGPKNQLAKIFGIPEGLEACEVLSARRMVFLDSGKVNDKFFLTSVSFPARGVKINCDDRYSLEAVTSGEVCIYNLIDVSSLEKNLLFDPTDGFLNIQISPQVAWSPVRAMSGWLGREELTSADLSKPTTVRVKKISAESGRPLTAYADGLPLRDMKFEISIVPKSARVIVGKNRAF